MKERTIGIGEKVEIIKAVYLGRWITPLEQGEIVSRHCSPSGQEVYEVELNDGHIFTFAPDEIDIKADKEQQ